MTKTLDTLIPDVYELVNKGFKPSEENLELFTKGMRESLSHAFEQGCGERAPYLRMSNLGTPDRKLWYIMHGWPTGSIAPAQAIAFVYGHMIEQLLLLLAREAGHTVEDEQREVELDGIIGHLDAKIDGILVDVKGMSNYNFQKFMSTATLCENDTYGYVPQISGYAQALGVDQAGFFVYNKERGTLILCMLGEFELINARSRIAHVKTMIASDTPPQRCFKPVQQTKTSPNLVLDTQCAWCPFKIDCWKDANSGQGLRAFKYANKVEYFVDIQSMPRVEEIPLKKVKIEITEEIIEI